MSRRRIWKSARYNATTRRRDPVPQTQLGIDISPKDKLEQLDRMFGPGLGAAKERAKIEKLLKKEADKPAKVETVTTEAPEAERVKRVSKQKKKEIHDKKKAES